ncbi:MAG: small, acid-soluble spore protein, alpha/beta type [Clostridia bacterium]|nr:small, acid-soluble spore protein, alpha/beta type [Clostridiales bacterium]MBQ2977841.1 small, acid-soluble spore protein, alpha/beta type [Clostridia bacterium]MBQ6803095.1 small, acid-soluble spore protein, alpha/beta type [Clostridia bacterium]MDD6681704.1 small, acid-soluble spore protein, alpha/beta type [Clostridiales bacterium]
MRMLSFEDRLKYEAARELGLLPRLMQVGWAGLTAAESGRIGGKVGAIKRKKRD